MEINESDDYIILEILEEEIYLLENQMKKYYNLIEQVTINKLKLLQLPKGDMVEISSLKSERLYKITLSKNSVRGNHYHYEQTENFYINNGYVYFLLAHKDDINVIYSFITTKNDSVTVKPYIIHTVINDFLNNVPEIIINSTQKYIEDKIPDTKYINIV
jgi:oxalate decarboxylase/phosphoglucose isomerase-like protein (cupin superfamily)